MAYHLKYKGQEIDKRLDLAGTALQAHQDISHLATKNELQVEVAKKQDAITDLDSIRSGAEKGATALQGSEASGELDDVETVGSAVKYEPQNLSESQKVQARANIGAASVEELQRMYNELLALIQGGVVTPSYAILDQAILDHVILS